MCVCRFRFVYVGRCVCVCVCARARSCVRACVCMRARACVRACGRMCARETGRQHCRYWTWHRSAMSVAPARSFSRQRSSRPRAAHLRSASIAQALPCPLSSSLPCRVPCHHHRSAVSLVIIIAVPCPLLSSLPSHAAYPLAYARLGWCLWATDEDGMARGIHGRMRETAQPGDCYIADARGASRRGRPCWRHWRQSPKCPSRSGRCCV